ncbi:M56 family metallopeptidase [Actinoplanes sp. TBRC 11911]|uniref:M56 family metallopeptidase n=1 Tax=Actinoplanes sp. TBRC 11911 TaxID=2729386 RepID=UPI00145CCACB|nr:M56 family metallopeptidase [Actinoplanes sp. TBRC 11911]NMO51581.1 M56 family metallopeptidase [Actinoplanes sp. TBRC 11911]
MTALYLGLLGLLLSLVVPGPLAAARWPDRAPAGAIVLWQAITLAAVLSALGVVFAAPQEFTQAIGSGKLVMAAALSGSLAVAALIVARLLISLYGVSKRSRVRRQRHRTLVDLLDRVEASRALGGSDQLRVLDGALPLAYCVPGREPRVVLSDGALKVLDRGQVDAVVAHEQVHLRHRHDVVMESFTAFYQAVPRPLRSRRPLDAVRLMLEMVSDDGARRRCGAGPLRTAIERLTDAVPLTEEVAVSEGEDRRRRLDRLAVSHTPSVTLTVVSVIIAGAILVLPTVVLVVPWLDEALNYWPF